jgi:hypothetical protein
METVSAYLTVEANAKPRVSIATFENSFICFFPSVARSHSCASDQLLMDNQALLGEIP